MTSTSQVLSQSRPTVLLIFFTLVPASEILPRRRWQNISQLHRLLLWHLAKEPDFTNELNQGQLSHLHPLAHCQAIINVNFILILSLPGSFLAYT